MAVVSSGRRTDGQREHGRGRNLDAVKLVVRARTEASVTLTWEAAAARSGVAGYNLYSDGLAVGTSQTSSAVFGGYWGGEGHSRGVQTVTNCRRVSAARA